MTAKRAVWMAVVAAGLAIGVGDAFGQAKSWIVSSPESWFVPNFWSPQGIPGTTNVVFVGNLPGAGPCVVNAPGATAEGINVTGVSTPGELRVESGGQISVLDLVLVGSEAGLEGKVDVSGSSSNLETTMLAVGYDGIGTLDLHDGGIVHVLDATVVGGSGEGSGGDGLVIIRDGGFLDPDQGVAIGFGGVGEIRVEPGGRTRIGQGLQCGAFGGDGTLFVDGGGPDNSLTNVEVLGYLTFGIRADSVAELTITNGGRMAIFQYAIDLGFDEGSSALMQVTGPGSEFTGSEIAVGNNGAGQLLIANGGNVLVFDDCTFGLGVGPGVGLVTGQGSRLEVDGALTVGYVGSGELTVANAGEVVCPSLIMLGGVLNIGAPPGEPAAAPGVLNLANGHIGVFPLIGTVNFNHTGTYNLENPSGDPIRLEGGIDVHQSGPGVAILRATDSGFSGGTTISSGVLRAVSNGSLGAGSVTLQTGGVLMNQEADLDLFSGRTINLSQGEGRLRAGWSQTFTVNGPISGPGDLVVTNDSGAVVLAGAPKTYAGATIVGRDVANGGFGTTSTLRLGSDNVLPTSTHLRFHAGSGGSATLDLNGRAQRVQSASLSSGSATLGGGGQLTVWGTPSGSPVAGTLTVTGPTTLSLDGGIMTSTAVNLGAAAALRGNGAVGTVTLASGATLAPGSSVGAIFGGATTIEGGAILDWEMAQMDLEDFDGWGVGWDAYGTFNTVAISATPENPVTLRISTLDPIGGEPGEAAGFDPNQPDSWLLFGGSSMSGFDPAAFVVDASGFANAHSGVFSVRLATGDSIMLDYTPGAAGNGDCDGSGSINLIDFSTFSSCFAGPGVAPAPGCGCADLDGDGDVDLSDFSTFSTLFGG